MMTKFLILIILFTFVFSSEDKYSIRFEKINVEHGLSQSTIYKIHQDKKGFIWIGTQDGLNLYNGKSFYIYKHRPFDKNSLTRNSISNIFEDQNSGIWIVTTGRRQLNYINRNSEIVQNHFYSHDDGIDKAIHSINTETMLHTNRNSYIFIGSRTNHFYLFDIRDRTYHQSKLKNDEKIINAVSDNNKVIWVLTDKQRVYRIYWAQKKFHTVQHKFKIDAQILSLFAHNDYIILSNQNKSFRYHIRNNTVQSINTGPNFNHTIDRRYHRNAVMFYRNLPKDRFAFKNNNNSLLIIKNSKVEFKVLKKIGIDESTNDLIIDNENNVWLTSESNGISLYDKSFNYLRSFKRNGLDPYSLSSNTVSSILKDNSGIIWIGTSGAGINKYDHRRQKFEHLWYKSGTKYTDHTVWAMTLESKDRLWIGTSRNGLVLYDIPKDKIIKELPLKNKMVRDLLNDPDNGLWIASYDGLYLKKKDGQLKLFNYSKKNENSLSSRYVQNIFKDSKSRIWVATSHGLNLYLGNEKFKRFKRKKNNPNSIASNYVSSVTELNGEIWVAGSNGLSHLDSNLTKFTNYHHNPENRNSLSTNSLMSLLTDEDKIWIGTFGGGLNVFKPKTGTFQYFTEKDGLVNDVVYSILKDDNGYLWMSTNQGLSRLDPLTQQFRNYTVRDGLQSNEFNSGAAYKDSYGRIFFGGINGISMFHPEQVKDYPNNSALVLTSFKSMNTKKEFEDDLTTVKNIELDYNENFFNFEFSLLDFTDQDHITYEYRLKNFEENWHRHIGISEASYTNVNAGDYVFQVRAANQDGQWGNLLEVEVNISPPFWEQIWFHLLLLLILISGIYSTYKIRMKKKIKHLMEIENIKIEENERIRRKTADDFHDEMGNKLTRISVLSDLITRKLNKGNYDIIAQIKNIRENADNLYHGTRDFIWSIDPKNDSFYDLAIRLKDFGDDFFDNTEINFKVTGLNESYENINLNIDKRRHIILIFKEAMTNILKHSDATNVRLEYYFENDRIKIVLSDDGKGFRLKDAEDTGNGLSNFKRRIRKINGSLEINTSIGKGCRIEYIDLEKETIQETV